MEKSRLDPGQASRIRNTAFNITKLGDRDGLPQRVLYPYVQHGRLEGRAEKKETIRNLESAMVWRSRFSILMSSMDGSYDALKTEPSLNKTEPSLNITERSPKLDRCDGLAQPVLYPYVQQGPLVRRAVHSNHLLPYVFPYITVCRYRYRSSLPNHISRIRGGHGSNQQYNLL